MREKNGRAKRYKESGGQFKHWKSPLSAHSKRTGKGSAFQYCFIAWENGFVTEEKRGWRRSPGTAAAARAVFCSVKNPWSACPAYPS